MCLTWWCWVLGELVELARILAWPLTVLALSVLFRHRVADLLARIRRFLLPGGAGVELGPPDSYSATPLPEPAKPPSPAPAGPSATGTLTVQGSAAAMADMRTEELATLPALSESAPTLAINKAWALVSGEAVGAARRAGATFSPVLNQVPASAVEKELVERGVLEPAAMKVLQRLRDINVSVASGTEKATVPSAASYVLTATSLFQALRKWQPTKK